MYKWLLTIFIVITWVTADYALEDQEARINSLNSQITQLQTELTTIKHQQDFINAVNDDLSDRIAAAQGWK